MFILPGRFCRPRSRYCWSVVICSSLACSRKSSRATAAQRLSSSRLSWFWSPLPCWRCFCSRKKSDNDIRHFVSRHFSRPQYDFRSIWTRFTQSTSSAIDDPTLCAASAELISETFNVLSVGVWLFDDEKSKLQTGSLDFSRPRHASERDAIEFPADRSGHHSDAKSFRFGKNQGRRGDETLREISETQFSEGGNRVGVPLLAGDRYLGLIILADRVNGVPYTVEELELLECIGDQVASSLLNLRLAKEIMLGKELEAFQTISAFFVHDLKNAASTLKLTLQNLPVHFDDPVFRQDTLPFHSARRQPHQPDYRAFGSAWEASSSCGLPRLT